MSALGSSVESERTVVMITYVLHLVGSVAGIPSIVALVLNYVRRGRGYGDGYDSHHRWMIRSFWWAVVGLAIGFCTIWLLIGWVICFVVWVWYIYRHVRGLLALLNGEPMPG